MVCQGKEPLSVPLFELLVDGHHLDVLVLLNVVPWSGVRLGPDDCTSIESEIGERGRTKVRWWRLTTRTTRKAGEIPRTTSNCSAYNNIAMDNKSSLEVRGGARRWCSHRDGLGELANSANQPLACQTSDAYLYGPPVPHEGSTSGSRHCWFID